MLFRIFSEYSVQYYHCNFSKYVTRMPFLLPDFHSNAIIRRWRTYENIPCLLYWLLSVIDINHACSKIFICSNLFFLGLYIISAILVMIIRPVNHPNREVDCQENHTFMRKTYLTLLLSLICAVFFIYIKSTRYMFLQALVFFIIFVTSLIGRLLYKD